MKIGEVAAATGCSVETVRYYERQGLLPKAHRSGNGYRSYDKSHEKVLRFIRNCRSLNMSHSEIKILLQSQGNNAHSCGAINRVIDEHIEHVEARLQELSELHKTLRKIRRLCTKGQSGCGILAGLFGMKISDNRWNKTHL